MSDSRKKEDELSNAFTNEIFANDDPAIDDDDDLVLEVDDKPWNDNYLEDENCLISNDLIYQLNPNIDFNIDPFNKEKPMEHSYSDQIINEKNDSNIVFNFSNQTESYETKETKKDSNAKILPFEQQRKPLPRVTSHPIQPQMNLCSNINFPNNSFTMNGKSGWICSSCKNFNYEMRTQCNRCGRAQILFNSYSLNNNSDININTNNDIANNNQYMNGMNINYTKSNNMLSSMSPNKMLSMKYSHSYSPKVKKNDEKKKKPFIEREGDWICYKCKNLNFAFRTNCNRCNLSKADNQQIIQSYMNSYTNVQLVNKSELDKVNQKDSLGTIEYYKNNTQQ